MAVNLFNFGYSISSYYRQKLKSSIIKTLYYFGNNCIQCIIQLASNYITYNTKIYIKSTLLWNKQQLTIYSL